jgi:hypothetical protein
MKPMQKAAHGLWAAFLGLGGGHSANVGMYRVHRDNRIWIHCPAAHRRAVRSCVWEAFPLSCTGCPQFAPCCDWLRLVL